MTITQEQIDAIEAKAAVDESVICGVLSRVPPSWQMLGPFGSGGKFRRGSVNVLFTVCRYEDGRTWVHASVSAGTGAAQHLPTWEELKRVKHDFIGPDRWAYQVFPSQAQYVNQNPNVLHLYALLDGTAALPDFTWGLGCI